MRPPRLSRRWGWQLRDGRSRSSESSSLSAGPTPCTCRCSITCRPGPVPGAVRWLFVYSFGAASLAAIGVDWVFSRLAARDEPHAAPGRGIATRAGTWRLVIVGVLLVALAGRPFPSQPPSPADRAALGGRAVRAFAAAAIALRWPIPALSPLLGLVVVAEARLRRDGSAQRTQRRQWCSTAIDRCPPT